MGVGIYSKTRHGVGRGANNQVEGLREMAVTEEATSIPQEITGTPEEAVQNRRVLIYRCRCAEQQKDCTTTTCPTHTFSTARIVRVYSL